MTSNLRYITQITKQDLKDIADAVNIQAGTCILISRTADGIEVSLDEDALRQLIILSYQKSQGVDKNVLKNVL